MRKSQFNSIIIFSLVSILITFVSCDKNEFNKSDSSNESFESLYQTQGEEVSELEFYYHKMISSENYRVFASKKDEFISKMNFDDDIMYLQNEEGIKDWLKNNISKTDFVDFDEALTRYEILKAELVVIITENEGFFLQTAKPEFVEKFIPILDEDPFGNYESYGTCVNGCINDGVACDREARENYAIAMGAGGAAWFGTPVIGGIAWIAATVTFNNAEAACARGVRNCYEDCK